MSYSVLERLLTQVNRNATICGKYWFVILYTCRIVITGAILNPVYSDEQSSFKCNTLQVGCENVCFNQISPMSQIRFWTVQIIFTCAPTVIFILWAMNSVHCMNHLVRQIMEERDMQVLRETIKSRATGNSWDSSMYSENTDKRLNKVIKNDIEVIVQQLPSILWAYIFQLLVRIALECGFSVLQIYIYGFQIKPIYDCDKLPCRVLTECYMSKPKEKTIFTWIMFGLTIWSIFMSASEMIFLGWKTIRHIYKNDVSITIYGEEISPKKKFRLAAISGALYSMNRDFGIKFYSDPMNQDIRLNLPIESCLLQFVERNRDRKYQKTDYDEDDDKDEEDELEDLEDDYAYYYGEDEDSEDSSSDDDEDFDFGGGGSDNCGIQSG